MIIYAYSKATPLAKRSIASQPHKRAASLRRDLRRPLPLLTYLADSGRVCIPFLPGPIIHSTIALRLQISLEESPEIFGKGDPFQGRSPLRRIIYFRIQTHLNIHCI